MTPEIRNPHYNARNTIDCEIEHPVYGWIPYTTNPNAVEGSQPYQVLASILAGEAGEIAPYIAPIPTVEELAETERVWRDGEIAHTDYLAMPDYPLTDAQRTELYAYRQALRDWPSADSFPTADNRPQPPTWLAAIIDPAA